MYLISVVLTCAKFHPDGMILATGTENGIRIWDLNERILTPCLVGQVAQVKDLDFTSNGNNKKFINNFF